MKLIRNQRNYFILFFQIVIIHEENMFNSPSRYVRNDLVIELRKKKKILKNVINIHYKFTKIKIIQNHRV